MVRTAANVIPLWNAKPKTKRFTAHVKLIHDLNFVEAGIPGNSVFLGDSSHLEPHIYSKKQMSYFWKLHEANIWEFNTLTPKRCGCNLKLVIFKLISRIDSLKNALRWMPQDLRDDQPTLAQVMACCRALMLVRLKAIAWTNVHQSSVSSYGLTRSRADESNNLFQCETTMMGLPWLLLLAKYTIVNLKQFQPNKWSKISYDIWLNPQLYAL